MFHTMARRDAVRVPGGLLPALYFNLEGALTRADRQVESLTHLQQASVSEKASACSRLELQERKEEESAAEIARLKESLKLKAEELEAAQRRSQRECEEKEVGRRRTHVPDARFRALVQVTTELNQRNQVWKQREQEVTDEMEDLEAKFRENLAETEGGLRASCRALVRVTGGLKQKVCGWKRKEQEMEGEREELEVSAEREQSLKTLTVHKKKVRQREAEVPNRVILHRSEAGAGGGHWLVPLPSCPASIFFGRVLSIVTFIYWLNM